MHKNIDKIFQDKLKEIEIEPAEKVWESIEKKLRKKKRNVVPIWWFSGVAAILILGLIAYPFPKENLIKDSINNNINITITPKKNNSIKELLNNKSNTNIVTTVIDSVKAFKKNKNLISKKSTKTYAEKIEENIVKNNKNQKLLFTKVESNYSLKSKTSTHKEDFIKSITTKDSIKKDTPKDWYITPTFAILNSNSFSGSSPLGENLNSNVIAGKTNYSYGIKISYSINNRWLIESGVHIQRISYSNNNLSLAIPSIASTISNPILNSNTDYINTNDLNIKKTTSINLTNNVQTINNATLTQTYGYIEIPIEIKYLLFQQKRFNSKIIAGVSSLFLDKNEVFVSSPTISKKLGQADNLNKLNFSGNIGLDVDFELNNNLIWNINPMLKTQLNTFSRKNNQFKPYILGIYTGIKYKF